MKKILIISIIFTFVFSLQSCDPFNYPTGIWICDDLGITLDFDDTEGGAHYVTNKNGIGMTHYVGGRGELVIDGISFEIICRFHVSGGLRIGYPYEYGEYDEHGHRTDWLFVGELTNKGKNKMTYAIDKDAIYTFVKQE